MFKGSGVRGINFFYFLQTHTQAERMIVGAKRVALFKEVSEKKNSDTLQLQLEELESVKPRPCGTFDAVCGIFYFNSNCIIRQNKPNSCRIT